MQKFLAFAFALLLTNTESFSQVHTTYLWHMQQPIYWPDASAANPFHWQAAKESQDMKFGGQNNYADGLAHPLNDLEEIFSKQDRVAAYQFRPKDAVQTLLGYSEAGAQVNYSGCLIENVNSLAAANQWGYFNNWENNFVTARNWNTSGGFPRMDLTAFSYHHVLSPLVSREVLRKQIRAHRIMYQQTFGSSPDYSKGYWPAECSFSERIIDVLVEEGIEWTVIANSHIARTLQDYPLNFGTNGTNYDPPNAADVTNISGNNWWNGQIDGRGGTFAAPICYQPHWVRYVNPETGEESKIIGVPMADLLSYRDGFAPMSTDDIQNHIAPYEDSSRPSLVLLAHDGDNAFGGGFSYYLESVPGFASQAASQGYVPTTIEQYLNDHPVPASDVIHVEDGSWVNAANDWGHPQFINWMWPQYDSETHEFDPDGWTEDVRNWAVLTAAENHVQMAEDLSGGVDMNDIVFPGPQSSNAELAWHFLMPGYTSGYMYYGSSIDMEIKQTIACNQAIALAAPVISGQSANDETPPSVFVPQRYPYNPGGTGFGPNYGYQTFNNPSDFTVWTMAYDVSGIDSSYVAFRIDADGENPLSNDENETYAGGSGVGAWQTITMSERVMPVGNITNNPEIDFFVFPDAIASQYYAKIEGLSEVLVDYYVVVVDENGNEQKTDIQHVYVGESTPVNSGGGGDDYMVSWTPQNPELGDVITITVTDANQGAKLHWGVSEGSQSFQTPISAYQPAGSMPWPGSGAIETAFIGPDTAGNLTLDIGPFDNPAQMPSAIDFVIHFDDDTWDNNNGVDYKINLPTEGIPDGVSWTPSAPSKNQTITVYVNGATQGAKLHWGVQTSSGSWSAPISDYQPAGTTDWPFSDAVETQMDGPMDGLLSLELGPFNNPLQEIQGINFVIHHDNDTWDNNNGNDYFIAVSNDVECTQVVNLNSVVNSPSSATLSWDPVDDALGYQLQGRRQGGSPVSINILDGQSSKTVNGLLPGSTYQWRVRAICSQSERGPYSQVASFSTPANMLGDANVSIWPNPADDIANVVIRNSDESVLEVKLYGLDGRLIKSEMTDEMGQVQFNVSDLAKGVYLIRSEGSTPISKNLIVR
ncbi:MAG: T9SS type A sorting domain-containing protein [Bacteroidota bacterium]